jgi:phage tail-like protein
MSSAGSRREAFGTYHFLVEISGLPSGHFRACSGLKSEAEVVAVQAGGVNSYKHKLIGRTKLANVVLKRGFAGPQLWNKRQSLVGRDGGGIKRFNGSIIQLGPGDKKVHEWQFRHAWICKWEGPEFDANKNEVSVETIEIAHEGLTHVRGSASTGASASQKAASTNAKSDTGRGPTTQNAKSSTSDQETLNLATDIKKYNRDPEATASEIVHEATHAQHEVDFPTEVTSTKSWGFDSKRKRKASCVMMFESDTMTFRRACSSCNPRPS